MDLGAERKKISEYRSEVIEKFINIECLMNAIISQHYFKRVVLPFFLEVLYDEYFSFALRRRVLGKIVKIDAKIIENLNRLNTIRNYFAHCNQEIFEISDKDKKYGKIVDPRNTTKGIDFESLYVEFNTKEKDVAGYLFELYKSLGGKFETA